MMRGRSLPLCCHSVSTTRDLVLLLTCEFSPHVSDRRRLRYDVLTHRLYVDDLVDPPNRKASCRRRPW